MLASRYLFVCCLYCWLSICTCACPPRSQVLPQLINLKHLDISRNRLGESDARLLAPALEHLVSLIELQAGNRWGVEGMELLLRAASQLTQLQVLELAPERNENEEMGEETEEEEEDDEMGQVYEGGQEDEAQASEEEEEEGQEHAGEGQEEGEAGGEDLQRSRQGVVYVALTPQDLHRLVPAVCQLGALKQLRELRLVHGGVRVVGEADRKAIRAALPCLQALYM